MSERKFYNTPLFRQCILSTSISIAYFNIGLVRGYSSPAFPNIKSEHPHLLPNLDISSWAGSIPPFGAVFGSLLAGPLLHYFGRKYTVLISSPIWTMSWAIIGWAQNWQYIMAGRFFSGFCAGLCLPSAQIYVTECTDSKIRGIIGSFPSMYMSAGILCSAIAGTFVNFKILAIISMACSICLFVTIMFLPDSPTWLNVRHKEDRAKRAEKWLKLEIRTIQTQDKESVVEGIEYGHKSADIDEKPSSSNEPNPNSFKALLTRPVLYPLGIGLTIMFIQQTSGIDTVIFYSVDIFRASGSSIDGNVAAIIVALVQLVSNFSALFIVDRFGRKPLLISSAIIMCLSMCSMGIAFYLNSIGNTKFGFLPVSSLITYMIGFSIGFGSIPYLLMGELYPSQHRSLMSAITGSFNLATMFLVIKGYHSLESMITTAGTFWMYSVLCFLGLFFVIFYVPETKGRDTEDIAKLFHKK